MNVQSRIEMPQGLSVDAFFEWSNRRPERYELVKGVPRVQPWVKRKHSQITSNISFLLQTSLDRDRFDVHQGDFAIATGPATLRYADVLVEPSGAPGNGRTTDNAFLIVEVLSPSTTPGDFGSKRSEYLALATLLAYLIVAQDKSGVWLWTRQPDGEWPKDPEILESGQVGLPPFALELPLTEIYRSVHFAGGS